MSYLPYYIRERFPEKGEAIAFLMANDDSFFALCEDYGVCIKAHRYWTHSKEPDAGTRVREYRDLIQALESEIEEALAAPHPERLG